MQYRCEMWTAVWSWTAAQVDKMLAYVEFAALPKCRNSDNSMQTTGKKPQNNKAMSETEAAEIKCLFGLID